MAKASRHPEERVHQAPLTCTEGMDGVPRGNSRDKASFVHLEQTTKPVFPDIQVTFYKLDHIFFFTFYSSTFLCIQVFFYHSSFQLSLAHFLFTFSLFALHETQYSTKNTPNI